MFDWKRVLALVALAVLCGCTTEAAKKALNKPAETDQFAGFDKESNERNKRKAELPKPVADTVDAEKAVTTLVEQLQKPQASFSISAEDQLNYWGGKNGVAEIVVRKVRPLLKSPHVEQRAPALRLTIAFGNRDSVGDLIECLNDSEYGIRDTAYRALQALSSQDFAYDPAGGSSARAQGVDQFRRWWQLKQRESSVQPATVYEKNPVAQPKVVTPDGR
jgi:hypothetical protein